MGEEQVAAVYARALFDAAAEAGVVEPVRRELDGFADALAASAPLRDVLFDPRIGVAAKRRVLAELTRDAQRLVGNAAPAAARSWTPVPRRRDTRRLRRARRA